MIPDLYCEARLLRAGLANRLFPWARCRIYARAHGVQMLAQQWAQVPLGTLLRGEKDLRTYTNLFQPHSADIGGLKSAYIRMRARKLPEPGSLVSPVSRPPGLHLVVFEGMRGQFAPINPWHALLHDELLAITRPQWREKARAVPGPFIGLHVRRGDFQRISGATDLAKADNTMTPTRWFVDTLRAARDALPSPLPAVVTSDGTDEELRELLAEPGIQRVDTGSAIGDLLVLARSRVLLASGSSFSAWASFLGQMPTLSHPGQSLTRLFGLRSATGCFVGEVDPTHADDLPRLLLRPQTA